jgi:hypothetical protein
MELDNHADCDPSNPQQLDCTWCCNNGNCVDRLINGDSDETATAATVQLNGGNGNGDAQTTGEKQNKTKQKHQQNKKKNSFSNRSITNSKFC